jgi:hypothetical protein
VSIRLASRTLCRRRDQLGAIGHWAAKGASVERDALARSQRRTAKNAGHSWDEVNRIEQVTSCLQSTFADELR